MQCPPRTLFRLLLATCVLSFDRVILPGSILLSNPSLCVGSFMGVFSIFCGFTPFGVAPLLTYCCSSFMCGSNSLSMCNIIGITGILKCRKTGPRIIVKV